MADKVEQIVRDFVSSFSEKESRAIKPYDTEAKVIRIDGNTAWVHIPNGIDETPVKRTTNAQPGDTVQVRVAGGRAWLTGNATNPPTDDTRANIAYNFANTANVNAEYAIQDADRANKEANRAYLYAEEAKGSADQAQGQAQRATTYANNALDQLGIVQDVVGVLDWASTHGNFIPTEDEHIVEHKVYFILDPTTHDYMPVVNPQESELSNYYELSMQEAMQTYILSHLAVTGRGLWVLPNGINTGSVTPESGETEEDARARTGANYKVLLSNDGMSIYDGTGKVIASYGSNIRFSSDTAQYIGGENAYIVFDPITGSLTIGGSLISFDDTPLSQLLEDIEEAALPNLRIDSSRGTVFKNAEVSTVLSVVIYYKSNRITTISQLHSLYSQTAYLEWQYQGYDETSWHTMSSDDPKISDGGFTLTLTPSDVNQKIVFRCNLNN